MEAQRNLKVSAALHRQIRVFAAEEDVSVALATEVLMAVGLDHADDARRLLAGHTKREQPQDIPG